VGRTNRPNGGQGSMTYASNLDPDSYLGFMAKIEDYDYKLIGLKADAGLRSSGADASAVVELARFGRNTLRVTEMRQTYIVEANAKPKSSSQKIGGDEVEQMIVVIAIDRAWLRLLVGTSGPGRV
jgi:hypothetical protein